MKLLLPFLITVAVVRVVRTNDTDSTTLPPTTTEFVPTYDYVVEIGFNLDENKVPGYLIDIIYEEASNKSITTDDIFTLYGIKTVDRLTTLDFLNQLGISAEKIFSLDGFDKFLTELRVDFKEFYNRVIIGGLNITGNPLRAVLVTLNIDINNFSMGMAYGDPNPYDEFKKGNYTKENVVAALAAADKTLDDLFVASRDEFVSKALSLTPEQIVGSLRTYDFDKATALNLWNALGLSMESVYKINSFKRVLNELNKELNQVPCLGVITGPDNITINKKVYDTWSADADVVKPYAESITHKFMLLIKEKLDTEVDNILLLKAIAVEPYAEGIDYVDIGKTHRNLFNCKFVTLANQSIVTRDVAKVSNRADHLQIPKENVTELVLGSPLICDNKVYGLAREVSGDFIILDSFSGVTRIFSKAHLFGAMVALLVCIYFL